MNRENRLGTNDFFRVCARARKIIFEIAKYSKLFFTGNKNLFSFCVILLTFDDLPSDVKLIIRAYDFS